MNNFGDVSIAASLIPAGVLTTTTTGAAVDLLAYSGEAAVILNAAAGGVGTATVKLTHSDTSGGSYTDVAGATFTAVADAASHQKISVNTDEMKRFVKAVVTIAGDSASQTVAVSLIGLPQYQG